MKFEWKKQENANRTDKANLKTILRYKVADVEKQQYAVIKEKGK